LDAATEALEEDEWDIMEVKAECLPLNVVCQRKDTQGTYMSVFYASFATDKRIGLRQMQCVYRTLFLLYNTLNGRTYSMSNFNWVIPFLKDAPRLVKMVNAFKAKIDRAGLKFKFGVQVPQSPRHAMELDAMNGNTAWKESMGTELGQRNKYETFRILEDDEFLPVTYKKIPYHMVFDVKFDLRRKARLVAGGNWTDPSKEDIYSGVVSLDTIRLGFALASANGLTVCAADVSNAFLYRQTKEQTYVIAGPKFGPGVEGKRLVIDKGLYGLRSSAARFHEHLAAKLRSIVLEYHLYA
jgi:hypothetical protein